MGYVSHNKSRFIILKLEMKLIETTVKDIVNKTLHIEIKSKVLNTEYKKLIYKEV